MRIKDVQQITYHPSNNLINVISNASKVVTFEEMCSPLNTSLLFTVYISCLLVYSGKTTENSVIV